MKINYIRLIGISLSVLFICSYIFLCFEKMNVESKRIEETIVIDSLKRELYFNTEKEELSNDFFKKTHKAYVSFIHYNKYIDEVTINAFLKTSRYFGLDSNDYVFETSIAQICCESGASNYKDAKTKKKVLRGAAGEVGIAQILPSTGFYVLKTIDKKELNKAISILDISYPHFIKRKVMNQAAKKEVVLWLSNVKNNLFLWGYIMKTNLNGTGDINKALHIYNAGPGHYNKWNKRGKKSIEFSYVIRINKKKSRLLKNIIY